MFIGVDYHKRFSVTTTMDATGKIIDRQKIKNDPKQGKDPYGDNKPAYCSEITDLRNLN